MKPLSESIDDLTEAAEGLGGESGGLGQLSTIIQTLKNPTVALGGAFAGLAAAFTTINHEYANVMSNLIALTGSQEKANDAMAYARVIADELGQGVNETALAYQEIESAMTRTGATTNQSRELFEALSHAILTTGGTMEDVRDGAIELLNEGMAEGKVNGENLQEMLKGAMIPALDGMAKAAGVTVDEMASMLEEGMELNKFFPVFQQGLENAFGKGKIEGIDSAFARLKNTITNVLTDESLGVMKAFADTVDAARKRNRKYRSCFGVRFAQFQ